MNLLRISDLTPRDIDKIYSLADELKKGRHLDILKGKIFVIFFPETSLRTRVTFEKGINDLGGQAILLPPSTLDKREKFEDVIGYMENWIDGLIIRHNDYNKLEEISKYSSIPIINAMTSENHPCEILSDVYSISRLRDNYKDLTYTFVGKKANIYNSWETFLKKNSFSFICKNSPSSCWKSYRKSSFDYILIYDNIVSF